MDMIKALQQNYLLNSQDPNKMQAIQNNPIYKLLNKDKNCIFELQQNPSNLEKVIQTKLSQIGLNDKQQVIVMMSHLYGFETKDAASKAGITSEQLDEIYDSAMTIINGHTNPVPSTMLNNIKNIFKK